MDGLSSLFNPSPKDIGGWSDAGRLTKRSKGRVRRSRFRVGFIAVAAASFLTMFGEASAERYFALPAITQSIRTSGPAEPTAAWVQFCDEYPGECEVDRSEPAKIALDQDAWFILNQVNMHVNSLILSVTDQDHWGVIDRWDYPDDGLGDCEDIQLLKRRLLVEAGLPHRAMRMAVVIDETGSGHAVLMVMTDRGDFILDNKRDAILPWTQTGYVYLKREGSQSARWIALEGDASAIVTANR